jgi:adenylosuccinate lyase
MDVVDTANAWRYREAVDRVLLPRLGLLASRLIALAEGEADTAQAGRTHGQHAVPITFGFAVAEYVSRLGNRILFLRWAAHALPGKLSGAVGAYNAPSLLTKDPRALERRYLAHLGLVPASHSTQIVEPEAWSDLAHACVTALGVMANLADDMRHLQRTEIAEIAEPFRAEQVGSSTMPQKRNPVSFENVKSIWKAFMPRVITTYLDQISEHQRDLTNSASQRFSGELLAATAYAATRLGASIDGIRIERERMKANLGLSKGGIIAEALYVLLAKHGHHDAHEAVRRLTLEADRSGKGMLELAALDPELRPVLASLTPDERRVLDQPEEYRGLAADVARDVATTWRARLAGILPE